MTVLVGRYIEVVQLNNGVKISVRLKDKVYIFSVIVGLNGVI